MSRWCLIVATALVMPFPALADEAAVRHLSDADMVVALAAPRTTPPATQITQHAGYTAQLVQRKQSGMVEQHMDWNEIFIVQEGDATFNYGGSSVNAKETRPGETIGDSIANGSSFAIHKGDVVTIPAGTPHQMVLAPGAAIRYLDFKGHKD